MGKSGGSEITAINTIIITIFLIHMYFLSPTLDNNLFPLLYYQLTEAICRMLLDFLSKIKHATFWLCGYLIILNYKEQRIKKQTHHSDCRQWYTDTPLVVDTSLIQTFPLSAAKKIDKRQRVTSLNDWSQYQNNNTLYHIGKASHLWLKLPSNLFVQTVSVTSSQSRLLSLYSLLSM